ncbi:MAG: hypothetical protein PHF79_01375 [Candidatus Pacebacteria bacterium]|nr:hypothetical protein [Candidatus Paceibacterota bacterium]
MKYKNLSKGFGLLGVILIIVVALIVGGGVYYSVKSTGQGNNPAMYSTATSTLGASSTTSAAVGSSNPMSLRGLLAIGKNVMCTFSQTTAQGQTSGTVYLSANMLRGDFSLVTASSGKAIDSHMVRQGNDVYFWSSAQANQGVKMNFEQITQNQSQSQVQAQSNAGVSLDAQTDYKCTDWAVDQSRFTLPTTVKFVDVSAMMNSQIKIPTPTSVPSY